MPELKQLSDFYDPTKAGMAAINVMQNQQHLAMQQQNMERQGQHLEMQNLQAALKTANPMESYPIAAKIMTMAGQAPPDPTKYYANTQMFNDLLSATPGTPAHSKAMETWLATSKDSRDAVAGESQTSLARAGAGTMLAKAGLPSDPASAELMRQSGPMQSRVTDALAMNELEKEKTKALEDMRIEHEKVKVFTNTQLSTLIPAAKAAGLAIERAAPFVAMSDAVEQEYQKNVASMGKDKAYGIRREKMALNPEYMQFDQRRREALPKLKQELQQIEDEEAQLQSHAEMVAQGVEPLKEGETLELLAGSVDKTQMIKAYKRAHVAFTESPTPENHSALRNVKDEMDKTVTRLSERNKASAESMNIRRAGLDEKMREFTYKANRESDIGSAQADWMEKGGNVKDLPQIARKYNVKIDEIRDASKDPNRPLATTNVNIAEEKAEAKKVGEGFGDEYLDTQKASRSATVMLGKLDRMDTLLAGVTTGKLTPNITEIQSLGEAIGVKVDKSLGAKQAFTALSAEMALQLRNPAGGAGMPGAMSDKDREFLQSMTPSLAQTNEGNKLIIETARKVAQRDQQIAKMARAYRQKHGRMDEGFADEVAAYGEANPLFKGKSLPTSGQATAKGGAFDDAEKERRYQEYKRKNAK